jgi:phenylacetate-coenzyme A ligase PaaK-like adenylate-forming protein
MILEELFAIPPYSLESAAKERLLSDGLCNLTRMHYKKCDTYKKMINVIGFNPSLQCTSEQIPFIPVRLFKEYDLLSVPKNEIVKTLTSSGTSGQAVSKIYLDRENIKNQTKTLSEIISSFIGKKRLPLLLLDTELVKKDRSMYSARGAGIIGFTTFGRDITYALNENMEIDLPKVKIFFEKYTEDTVLMFGYTYMIWQHVVRRLEDEGVNLGISDGILFHIGGWKKLKEQAVDSLEYNCRIKDCFGNIRVYNYYGMAEQLGSVFVECEYGHMHCSNYSDIIIRRPKDFSVANLNEKGLIELVSLLPTSYPGHALLTEDEGEILGVDDCQCGRKGKYFRIHGRIKSAELRGCSDTYERH